MSDLSVSLAMRARDLLTHESEAVAGYGVPEMIALHDTVLKKLAKRIASDSDLDRRSLLRATSATGATVIAGLADLTSNFTTDRVLIEAIKSAEIRLNPDTNGNPFHYVGERSRLALKPLDTIFIRFAVEGLMLYTRDVDGSLTNSLGAISLFANFIPLVDGSIPLLQLPFELHDEFIEMEAQEAVALMPMRKGSRAQTGYSQTTPARRRV